MNKRDSSITFRVNGSYVENDWNPCYTDRDGEIP